MTDREIDKARKWCKEQLGYVPSEDEWMAVSQEDPGLVKLYLHVFDKISADRMMKKELYTYDKKPTTKMLRNDKEVKKVWDNDRKSKKNV